MQSRIFLDDKGLIEVVWTEVITGEEFVGMAKEMLTMVIGQQDKGLPARMLIDFSNLRTVTPEAIAIAIRATRDLGCDKVAGFNIDPEMKGVLDLVKERSTKADTIREFAGREEAEAWLLE